MLRRIIFFWSSITVNEFLATSVVLPFLIPPPFSFTENKQTKAINCLREMSISSSTQWPDERKLGKCVLLVELNCNITSIGKAASYLFTDPNTVSRDSPLVVLCSLLLDSLTTITKSGVGVAKCPLHEQRWDKQFPPTCIFHSDSTRPLFTCSQYF